MICPSARPAAEAGPIFDKWVAMGYEIAIQRDPDKCLGFERFDLHTRPYQGYAEAMNFLSGYVFEKDPACDWVVCASDDTEPDMAHLATSTAEECSEHFGRVVYPEMSFLTPTYKNSFGVMQPTGDRFAQGSIDRICGSPWIGREFARRINQGKGPYWPEYFHNFADQELQEVATKYGVLWQRPDLIHLHRHFQRESELLNSPAIASPRPPHLVGKMANQKLWWDDPKKMFESRKIVGFPGSEFPGSEPL